VESEIVEAILKQCEEKAEHLDGSALVFAGEDWHLGVLGIVASRLVERFCRPVFVLSKAQGDNGAVRCLTGSGRSIPAFHLLEALENMPDLFRKFGGHRQAAGLTLQADNLREFQRRFGEFAAMRLSPDDLRPGYTVDAVTSFADIGDASVQDVLALGPFGFGNPLPIFCATQVEVAAPPKTLKDGKHLNVVLRQGGRTLVSKAWNFGDRVGLFEVGSKLDVLFQLEDDPYSRKRGYGSWCMSLKDARPSTSGLLPASHLLRSWRSGRYSQPLHRSDLL
jgi:single-stranded-DNA-specific exonuclease